MLANAKQNLTLLEESFCTAAVGLEEEAPKSGLRRCWQGLKFVVAAVFLVPFRIFMIFLTLLAIWCVCKLSDCCGCCCSRDSKSSNDAPRMRPHRPVQRALLRVNGLLVRCMLFWLGVLWIHERGPRPSSSKKQQQQRAPTIVANHCTMLDAFVITTLTKGQVTAVAVDWLATIPFIGGIARAYHVLHVPGASTAAKVVNTIDAKAAAHQAPPDIEQPSPADPPAVPVVVVAASEGQNAAADVGAAEPKVVVEEASAREASDPKLTLPEAALLPKAAQELPPPHHHHQQQQQQQQATLNVPGAAAPGGSSPSASPRTPGGTTASAASIIAGYQQATADDPRLLPLMIFPEGTTKMQRCLVKYRSGAFVSGLPVQPLVLRFPHRFCDISWVQPGVWQNIFKMLTQWYNPVEVQWLDVYKPDEAQRQDSQLYAEGVQSVFAAVLKLPEELSSRSVDNVVLARYRRAQAKLTSKRGSKVKPDKE